MNRRIFLRRSARSSFGLSLLPLMGCAHRGHDSKDAAIEVQRGVAPFETRIPKLMEELKVPGVSIAVIREGKLAWRRGFGVKDATSREPVDENTIFEGGSMSKPVFAYVALKLCEKGVIGLDTPLTKYSPQPFLTGDPRIELITPRHILSHTGGFQNMRSGKAPLKIHFEPGSEWLYSGEGYFYLQSVITHLKGKVDRSDCAKFEADLEVCATDFAEFMEANLLKPFGMRASGYSVKHGLENHAASPHDAEGKPLPKSKGGRPGIARYGSVGALQTTPSDYAKFMIEILEPRKADAFRLKIETIDEMLRPHVKVALGPNKSSWALGWQIQDQGLFNHGGDNKGFHCHSIASRERKSGFVVMTNSDGGPQLIQKLFVETLDSFFGLPKATGD